MIRPLKPYQTYAHNTKDCSAMGLKHRAEFCDFMAATTPHEAEYWRISAARRRNEIETAIIREANAKPPED